MKKLQVVLVCTVVAMAFTLGACSKSGGGEEADFYKLVDKAYKCKKDKKRWKGFDKLSKELEKKHKDKKTKKGEKPSKKMKKEMERFTKCLKDRLAITTPTPDDKKTDDKKTDDKKTDDEKTDDKKTDDEKTGK